MKNNLSKSIAFLKAELSKMNNNAETDNEELRNLYIDACNSLNDAIFYYSEINKIKSFQ